LRVQFSSNAFHFANEMSHQDCIFCKIISGSIPSFQVYSDDKVVAFLDIFPVAKGHTLVVPRSHGETLDQLSPEDAAAVMKAAQKIAKAVLKLEGVTGYNLLQNNGHAAGQIVMHSHLHIIPRRPNDGVMHFPKQGAKLSAEEGNAVRQQLVAHL